MYRFIKLVSYPDGIMILKDTFFFLGLSLAFAVSVMADPPINQMTNREKASKLYYDALFESHSTRKKSLLIQAHKLNPLDARISFHLGKLLIQSNNKKEGSKYLKMAFRNPKYRPSILRYLGEYYLSQKNYKKANHYLKRLIRSNRRENNYLNNYILGQINSRTGLKKYKASNKYYLKAYKIRKYKKNKDILLLVAENYYYQANYKKVLEYLKYYPHTNKNNRRAFRLLIKSHYKSRNRKELNESIAKYLKVWPKDRWARKIQIKSRKF
ncbi:MAG: hypothetical protein IEMM0008_0044 [bacterium]|nr:MAG: hypothetical protein IEMM0008_0044 [bacterium]